MSRRMSLVIVGVAASVGVACVLAVAPWGRVVAQPPPKTEAPKGGASKIAPPALLTPAQQAVMANVRAFTEAFNRRDVMTLLTLFTDDCTLTEADGSTVHGLKDFEAELKKTFEADPEAKISISVDALRQVAPDVIIEEGKTTFFPDGKTLTAETAYQATHVKKDDKWLMAQVRSFNRTVLSPYDQLRDLEWLVGDWVDEGEESIVESSYRWDANKAFLLQDFTVRVKGQKALAGTQRIGRDPLSKQIKGWVFDSAGSYAENQWTPGDDDSWTIKMNGVRTDGKLVTATNQLTRLGKDRARFQSERTVGDERMPAISSVLVRRPPAPKR